MIPIYKPYFDERETKYLNDCIKSTWISSKGKYIDIFEKKVCDYIGCRYSSSTSNGTTAIHLALLALGIGRGDEVITTNFTYVASTNAILMVGAKPVLTDVNPETWNIDTNLIQKKISKKTKAILVTNVYGLPCDFDHLKFICKKYKLFLIEDAAESLGAKYYSKSSGNLADISTLSFFGNKTITTGEGGMVLTNNKKLIDKVKILKNQGNDPNIKYFHKVLGYNYRMTNMQAAIGVAQIEKIDEILKKKSNLFLRYYNSLKHICDFQIPKPNINSSFWIIAVLFNSEKNKISVQNRLSKSKIETRPFFFPIDQLPFYTSQNDLPISKLIHKKGLCLPSFPALRDDEIKLITEKIKGE